MSKKHFGIPEWKEQNKCKVFHCFIISPIDQDEGTLPLT